MKKITLFLFLLTFICTVSSVYAGEYTYTNTDAKTVYKISTTKNSAIITATSSANFNQQFTASVWKTNSKNNSADKVMEQELYFNTPPPRSMSFPVYNLDKNKKYYLFDRSGSYEFKTEDVPIVACTSCNFTVAVSGSTSVATLSGIDAAQRDGMKVIMLPNPFGPEFICDGILDPLICGADQPQKDFLPDGTIKWTTPLDLFRGKTDYYVRAEGEYGGGVYLSPVKKITTGDEKVRSTWPLTYKVDDTKADISGKIENQNPADFSLKLQYSLKQFSDTGETLPTEAHEVTTTANSDGSYTFPLINLSPNRLYFVKQIIKATNRGALEIKVNSTGFNSTTGYKAEGSKEQLDDIKKRSYTLLAPFSEKLQVVLDPDLCREFVAQKKLTEGSCDNQISDFINLMITILIGIAVVVLVVQLIIQGYSYMVSDIPRLKAIAKSRFFEALLGLLLALSSYLILNTINPKLVSNTLNIDTVNVSVITDFDISGNSGLSFNGQPIKVNFNKTAYPAAKVAEQKTGVERALVLAIFGQETGNGSNTGRCNYLTANMDKPGETTQLEALKRVATKLNLDYKTINMSCSGGGSTRGGAIGLTQFIPSTWEEHSNEATQYLGYAPNPWKPEDALMMTAVFLKNKGGSGSNLNNQESAACRYFGSCTKNGGPLTISCGGGKTGTYGQCIMGKKLSIQQQIDAAIKKGEITYHHIVQLLHA